MRSHRLWPVLAIAFASLVLGIGATAALYAAGPFNRNGPASANGPYPTSPGVWGPGMMGPGMMGRGPFPAAPQSCAAPTLPGTVVDVNLSDMGAMMGPWGRGMMGMMGPGMMGPRMMPGMGMMRIFVNPSTVPAGQVSFRAINTGGLSHELVVLPLPQGLPGQRVSGPDGKVDETGSLGEASRTCGADKGDEQSAQYGILPGATGWTTVTLSPGRYELICNIAGHYRAGMNAPLELTG